MPPEPPFLRRARLADDAPTGRFPFDLPPVRQIAKVPFAQVTVIAGDNGSGKSTLVEALAVATGFNAEGGGRNLRFDTYATHSELHDSLVLTWRTRPRWGWFLRAETFYGMASTIALDDDPVEGLASRFPELHAESHGESFLDLARTRFRQRGLYFFDEPESALSLQGQLALMRLMHEACALGAQFVLATHSPVLMAYPEATIVELDGDGVTVVDYDDVLAVQLWRRFLDEPKSFLRQVLDA